MRTAPQPSRPMHRPRALRRSIAGLLALALAAGACSGGFEKHVRPEERAVLTSPDQVELLALDPGDGMGGNAGAEVGDAELFHGFQVRGRAPLAAPEDRARAVGLLREGIDAAGDLAALCFLPRHGLRVVRGAERVDAVICYQCLQVRLYDAQGRRTDARTSDTVEPEMSTLFRAQGLVLAPR